MLLRKLVHRHTGCFVQDFSQRDGEAAAKLRRRAFMMREWIA
jgi:hypothetical protein